MKNYVIAIAMIVFMAFSSESLLAQVYHPEIASTCLSDGSMDVNLEISVEANEEVGEVTFHQNGNLIIMMAPIKEVSDGDDEADGGDGAKIKTTTERNVPPNYVTGTNIIEVIVTRESTGEILGMNSAPHSCP